MSGNGKGGRLAVVGGVAAGLSAAAQARRIDPALEITVYERTGFCSYTACGLPYYVGGVIKDHRALVVRGPDELARDGIQVLLRHEVASIDPEAGRLEVSDLDGGGSRTEPYDQLMIATGGRPRLPFAGLDLPGCFFVRTVEDALAINAWLEQRSPERAVIVGAGYIGLEMAEALVGRGLAVSVVERLPHVLPFVDDDIAADIEAELVAQGVDVNCSVEVEAIEGDGERVRAVVTAAGLLEADLVVVGAGVGPDSPLAQSAGIELGPHGGVAVDPRMATSRPEVWAGGDCCETLHRLHDGPAYVPLGTTANKQGRVAGANLAGRKAEFQGVVGTAALKVFDLEVARTGLSQRDADEAGLDAVSVTITHKSRAAYYPGWQPLKVRMVAERGSGRLLGAQLVGREGAAKRIDTVAAMLYARQSVADAAALDLSYAPPFAPVWDPLLIAARKLEQLV